MKGGGADEGIDCGNGSCEGRGVGGSFDAEVGGRGDVEKAVADVVGDVDVGRFPAGWMGIEGVASRECGFDILGVERCLLEALSGARD